MKLVATITLCCLFCSPALHATPKEPPEPTSDYYGDAGVIFEKVVREANLLGIIKYCQIGDQFPTANKEVMIKVADSIDQSIGRDAHKEKTFKVLEMVDMFSGGVYQGLKFSQVANGEKSLNANVCSAAADAASTVFTRRKSGP